MKSSLFLTAFLSLILFSCHQLTGHRVRGNGNVQSQVRSVGNFRNIDVHGAIEVRLIQDSVPSVKVVADENLQEFIQVGTEGETLVIEPEDGYNLRPSKDLVVYVSNPAFQDISVSGASEISAEGKLTVANPVGIELSGASKLDLEINSPKIDVRATGASRVRLKGQTRDLYLDGQGASEFFCFDLLSENTRVEVSGASKAEVFASVKLQASASGASDIRYKGKPEVTQETSGAGSVKQVN